MRLSRTHTKPAHVALAPGSGAINSRQLRVEELRRLVARGAYKVSPQKLALRILVKSLGD